MTDTALAGTGIQECIVECDSCHDVCIETINYCLAMAGPHAEPAHVRLLMDCAQICHTASDFMLRGSTLYRAVCLVSAEVCEACATSCAELDGSEMKACADACRRCSEACRAMSGV